MAEYSHFALPEGLSKPIRSDVPNAAKRGSAGKFGNKYMAFNHWEFRKMEHRITADLAASYRLSPLLRRCLEARGIVDSASIASATGVGAPFSDPLLIDGMQAAKTCIRAALANGEKITVYGDYDVDGVTATYLLSSALRRLGADCGVYIPDRVGEGYGMNREAVEKIASDGTKLIVTVDCGVTAVAEIALAYELGMRVVVTDHHEPKEILPICEAIVDPKRAPRDGSSYYDLSGVGLAFKLASALLGDCETVFAEYGDVIALGTVADVVSLTMENRRIVSQGLEQLLYTKNYGLAALNRAAGFCDATHTATDVAYKLTPKLNAAGRMRSALEALKLLESDSDDAAERQAALLCALNTERQSEEKRVSSDAEAALLADPAPKAAIVLCGEQWKHGVVGISAAKLAEKYGCPTVLFAPDGDVIRASARSVEGFDLVEALVRATEGIGICGGHKMAAGVTLPVEHFEEFRKRFEAICRAERTQANGVPLVIDCETSPQELTEENITDLSRMEPFGAGNEKPIFAMRDVCIEDMIAIGAGKHVRMVVSSGGRRMNVLAFRRRRERMEYRIGDMIDVAFTAEVESYRGISSVKLILVDLRPSEALQAEEEVAVRLWKAAVDGYPAEQLAFPSRRTLGTLWRRVTELAAEGPITPALVCAGTDANAVETMLALTVFTQAGLLECDANCTDYRAERAVRICADPSTKADLCATELYTILTRQGRA